MSERLLAMGVDGAKSGWVAACLWSDGVTSRTTLELFTSIEELAAHRTADTIVAIDVPIGLQDDARPRACDIEARKALGKGGSSVFAAPARWMLAHVSDYDALRDEAAARKVVDPGTKSLSKQAWAIIPKIVEVDDFLASQPGADEWLVECHPEVCFAALGGGSPPSEGKKTDGGRSQRLALINGDFPDAAHVLNAVTWPKKLAAPDDLVDAYGALHAAIAFRDGQSTALGDGTTDSVGRAMRMVHGPIASTASGTAVKESPVVTLRPSRPDDVDFCLEAERDPEARPFISNSTREEHLAMIAGEDDHQIIEADGERAGFLILKPLDETNAIELGRLVVTRRGGGIGGRALRQAIDHVFETTAVHRFWLDVLPRNERAHRAYLGAGFVDEGILRDAWIGPAGNYETLQIMSILRPEWEARR